jgi:glycosyltransferase involved in cell wall biosynthesis
MAKAARAIVSPCQLAATIVRSRASIVHINSVLDHKAFWRDAVYVLTSKAFGCKVVLQMHGGSLPDLCRRRWVAWIVRRALALPNAIVLLATKEREDFAAQNVVERVSVVPNGVEVDQHDARARIHSGRIRRLAYIGRLIREKGVFEAIAAVERLRRHPGFERVELHIAGSGPAQREIEHYVQRRGLAHCVKLVGAVTGAAKSEFYRSADVLVFPTYHLEGLPYSILESLAAGTPVISTRTAGIPDAIVDGVHGKLIEPRDPDAIVAAVLELAASSDRLHRMSQACLGRARDCFSLERLAERFEELYDNLERRGRMAGAESG